ncbi:hypothetical protein C1Y40_00670 [Mycobacterium talmoniae]|uniref:Uncharacterized protein n=1 Tax=Mycobacterium talmoniae TaxID=1858794 RepID=A0A2S8BR38_9MYCO|nr:hypothetical protein C1Y40_00670 [Mycobacterium talmoniae]
MTPGRNSATAAANPASAIRIASRRAATSSSVLMRRAARIACSPSTNSALGNTNGNSWAKPGDSASVPTRLAAASPSMRCSLAMVFIGFHEIPYRFSCGMSSGTPSSQVDSKWTAPVSRIRMQVGPNGRVPATHSCGVPET